MIQLAEVAFGQACHNMSFDEDLLNKGEPVLRVYPWGQPGVTYAYRQALFSDLGQLDHAKRITGGGIVFHCPDDLVFSIVLPVEVLALFGKGRLSDFLFQLKSIIGEAVAGTGVLLESQAKPSYRTTDFCIGYESPYEWCRGHQKVMGIAVRRKKIHVLVQGILYLQPTAHWFSSFSEYRAFFTEGMGVTYTTVAPYFIQHLFDWLTLGSSALLPAKPSGKETFHGLS